MISKKLRKAFLATTAALTLTACGGGGGTSAIGTVTDFVTEDLSSLLGSESIINSYSSLLSGFNSTISSGNFANLSAIITGPNEQDISKANNLLTMLNQAETLWSQTLTLIESQDADTKLGIYNSDDYKNAHAALLYLKNHVKPVIQKVSQGKKLSLTEYNKVASDKKAQEIIKEEKDNTVETYVVDKKSKINAEKEKKVVKKEEKKEEEKKVVKEEVKEEKKEEVKKEVVKKEEKKEEVKKEVKKEEIKEDPWKGIEDKKQYIGTTTPNFNSDKTTYETNEYFFKDNNGSKQGWNELNQINASSAYSKGWTGKGSIVAVADTGYDIDHSEFSGQIYSTKDYTGTGINDNYGHGTHVLGTIVAKKDNSGMHGVAFDSKAIVIKIGDGSYVEINKAASGFVWAADQGAIVGNLSANSNYDHVFRNKDNLEELSDGTYKSTDSRYNYSDGKYYNMQTPDIWKTVTDKGMVIVNSSGNTVSGFEIAAHPGYFATVTDDNGNLVLGGKVLIVGAVDSNTNAMASWSNWAGHLCRNVVDNKCNDKYKVSDFYVLAPGWSYSTKNDGTYGTMAGTSMAAPFATGQVAILHQMWPHMKGENLVRLVTTTADKNINGYNVNIHGQGIIDLDEATKPQGTIGIPVDGRTDGKTSSINNSYVSGSSSAIASLSNINIMVLDDFDRDYYMNLGNSVVIQDKRKVSDIDAMMNGYTYLPINQMFGSFSQGGQYDLGYMNFGVFTGQNGNGDYSANIGKTFWVGNNFGIRTNVGQMNEQDTWLGNNSDGILAVGDNNITNYGQVGVSYQLGNNVLSLDYSKGFTDINTSNNSLIKGFDNIETESYKLAYEVHNDAHNSFGFSASLPSHVTSGSMNLEVAESVDLDGTINYTNINSDLTQKNKEKNVGFFFSHSPKNDMDASFNFTTEYRQDIAGVDGKDGIDVGISYIKKLTLACGIPDTGIKFLDDKLNFAKNTKCYNDDGKIKANLYNTNTNSDLDKHGLVYDMKTDKFIMKK